MSKTKENTNLKTRAEKVRAFLRGPVAEYGLFATAIGGVLGTVSGTSELAQRMIDAGNPATSLVAGGVGALGIATSFMLVRASDAVKEIFSEDKITATKAKRDFMRTAPRSSVIAGALMGFFFGTAALITQEIAHRDKSDEARVATLPALDPNTVLPPKTAAQEFCKARDGGHTIVVNVTRPNGTPAEFRLACPK